MRASAARIVERLCQRAKIAYSDEKLEGALPRLARASIEDVMSAVGRGEMKAVDVVARHVSRLQGRARRPPTRRKAERLVRAQARQGGEVQGSGRREHGAAIPIRGINTDLPVRFAPEAARCPATASSAS